MLTKDLLRVSRAGGGYQPRFTDPDDEALAAAVLEDFREHVGRTRRDLEAALRERERAARDYKLVRGFAKLVEREATFETRAPVEPERARRATFEAAESVGVVAAEERREALSRAAARLGDGVAPADVEASLYADLEARQVLASVDDRWSPAELLDQYDLSLAQTALFDATEVRVRSSDPKALVSAVKRLRLMYEIRATPEGREVVVSGPDALFRRSRRYGTRFARLLRSVARAAEWRLEATVDDRGTERTMVLTQDDVSVPDADPVAEVSYDSGVEADFAARFDALDLDWELTREPEPLAAGEHVVIPDFAFDYAPAGVRAGGGGASGPGAAEPDGEDGAPPRFRVFFEIMGFWTPEYVEKKLSRLADVEGVELLVAVDESLGVGEAIEARDHRAIPYSGTVRVKDVVDALRPYERDLVAESAAGLPDELVPQADAVTLADLAAARGVPEEALETASFPEHERVGRTLVRPAVLDAVDAALEPGMALSEAESVLAEYGLTDASAVLAALDYRVAWEGLGGGTLRER